MSILLAQKKSRKPVSPKKEKPRKPKVEAFKYGVTSCHFTIGNTVYGRGSTITLTTPEAKKGLEAGSLRKIE